VVSMLTTRKASISVLQQFSNQDCYNLLQSWIVLWSCKSWMFVVLWFGTDCVDGSTVKWTGHILLNFWTIFLSLRNRWGLMSAGMGHQRSGDAVSLCIGFWCTFLAGRLIKPSGIRGPLTTINIPMQFIYKVHRWALILSMRAAETWDLGSRLPETVEIDWFIFCSHHVWSRSKPVEAFWDFINYWHCAELKRCQNIVEKNTSQIAAETQLSPFLFSFFRMKNPVIVLLVIQ
jgi:hypothetical protein